MLKQQTVKAFSVVSIILSAIGLLISILGTLFLNKTEHTLAFFMGCVSWGFLLWAGILAYKLCSSYTLSDEEYKKVGTRVYIIIGAFFLFLFIGFVFGLIISVFILSTMWGLKKNYDDWEAKNAPYVPEDIEPIKVTDESATP